MRCELSDYEWSASKPMLPNKPRGVRANESTHAFAARFTASMISG